MIDGPIEQLRGRFAPSNRRPAARQRRFSAGVFFSSSSGRLSMTCKENSVGAGNRSSDTGRHNQCSASVPTCGTMRFKWDRADLVCGCPHSRSTGCGHKFGSVNPPPCGLHATAIAVARAQPARGVVGGDGNGVGCTASGQEIDELDAFLASEARPQERMVITPSTAFSPRWRSAPIFRFRADGLPVVWGSKSDPVVESAEQAHRIVSSSCGA